MDERVTGWLAIIAVPSVLVYLVTQSVTALALTALYEVGALVVLESLDL